MDPNPPAFLEENPIQLHCRENHWSRPATPKSTKSLSGEEGYTLQEWSNAGIPPAFLNIRAQPRPCSRARLSNLPLTSRTAPFLDGSFPCLPHYNPLVVQSQEHRGYIELLLSSQTLKQVKGIIWRDSQLFGTGCSLARDFRSVMTHLKQTATT